MGLISKFKNNCALVAIRDLTQRNDDDIVLAFLHNGWLPNQGTYTNTITNVMRWLDLSFDKIEVPKGSGSYGARNYGTTNYFRWNNRKGVFLLLTPTHAFVMRDGVIVDPNMRSERLKARVTEAYQIYNAKQSSILNRDLDEIASMF